MLEFIKSFLIWLFVFSISAFAASLTIKIRKHLQVVVMQTTMLIASFILIILINPKLLNIQLNLKIAILSFLTGFIIFFVVSLAFRNFSIKIDFLPDGLGKILLALFLAPLSEEMLNRALIEGYLINHTYLWSAIIFSALLFALPHYMAFEGKKIERVYITTSAFFMGLLSGYFFAISGIVASFLFHSSANLSGLVVNKIWEVVG